jgi:hypothetical protein
LIRAIADDFFETMYYGVHSVKARRETEMCEGRRGLLRGRCTQTSEAPYETNRTAAARADLV